MIFHSDHETFDTREMIQSPVHDENILALVISKDLRDVFTAVMNDNGATTILRIKGWSAPQKWCHLI
jgi:hypothetical protein